MKINHVLATLLLVPSLATPVPAQLRATDSDNRGHVDMRSTAGSRLQRFGIEGREIAAPPWSFACMSDQGPRQCEEPMWAYGSRDYLAQFNRAFSH
jgi:hypothetical protein